MTKSQIEEISIRKLKSYNGRYLSTLCSGCDGRPTTLPWIVGKTENWTFKFINDHEIALQGSNGMYLNHNYYNQAGYGERADEWEILTPVENKDGSFSFRSRWGKWLSAHRSNFIDFMPENKACEHWWIE
ncbi:hypothetical protein PRIPAC_74514 [Pristionchus pacificus]|nr:hypothetical protein PRIPAC_74514 [Pristionchus pacificus]